MEETYAHQLEGQTVIISSMPNGSGKKMPVGVFLSVRFQKTGIMIQNVTRIDFDPIIPNAPIFATLTLTHVVPAKEREGENELLEEQVRVEAQIDVVALVKEERHE